VAKTAFLASSLAFSSANSAFLAFSSALSVRDLGFSCSSFSDSLSVDSFFPFFLNFFDDFLLLPFFGVSSC
jgi:hypothetical protein